MRLSSKHTYAYALMMLVRIHRIHPHHARIPISGRIRAQFQAHYRQFLAICFDSRTADTFQLSNRQIDIPRDGVNNGTSLHPILDVGIYPNGAESASRFWIDSVTKLEVLVWLRQGHGANLASRITAGSHRFGIFLLADWITDHLRRLNGRDHDHTIFRDLPTLTTDRADLVTR